MNLSLHSVVPSPALRIDQVCCVTIDRSTLDPEAARVLLKAVEQAFADGARAVVVDLVNVVHLDSLGVSALAAAARKAPKGAVIVLSGLGGYVQSVARVTHLHELFPIYATRAAAVSALTTLRPRKVSPMDQDAPTVPPRSRANPSHAGAGRRRARLSMRRWVGRIGPSVRRTLDVLATSAGLLVLLPLLFAAAVAIKVTSRGPVLFKQERLGQGGRRFGMFKLRTMYLDAEARKTQLAIENAGATDGVRFKMKKDPRVTSVGRILRKLSIDELPQLYNVLIGDMTLVGPRPPVWREVALYDPRALRRLEVRPGLTCLWQIGGRSDLSFEQQVDLDLAYIDRTRPSEEILIVAKTIPAVLTGRGAY